LSDDTFAELVEESKEAWFVEFYAPWCGHCKNLTPVWKKLATAYKGKVNIAKVDSTVNRTVSERFGVKGYPSLKWFPAGLKSDSLVVEHEGGRDYDALSTWIETKTALSAPAKFK
jgi:protein disulfide-isomerase A6